MRGEQDGEEQTWLDGDEIEFREKEKERYKMIKTKRRERGERTRERGTEWGIIGVLEGERTREKCREGEDSG